jgi:glycosyltransferase involved in cell wall biosynthesis
MKLIQIHNYYRQAGGEDAVVAAERAMLEEHGHQIVTYYQSNDLIAGGSPAEAASPSQGKGWLSSLKSKVYGLESLLSTALKTIWNHQTYREFRKLLQQEKPDVVHCHNTFPLISPSIYRACAKENVPVVQTLHNYRLLCLNAFLFRQNKRTLNVETADGLVEGVEVDGGAKAARAETPLSTASTCNDFPPAADLPETENASPGAICELCVHKSFKWPGIRYRCYRGSFPGSLVVALMLFVHKLLGTWSKKVTAYIALTEFHKQKMIEGGLPEQKIWVKPNFIDVTSIKQKSEVRGQRSDGNISHKKHEEAQEGGLNEFDESQSDGLTNDSDLTCGRPYALFVGRLSAEKGCDVLIRAWQLCCEKWEVECEKSNALSTDHRERITDDNQPQLIIVGDGPERDSLEKLASHPASRIPHPALHFLGKQPKERVLSLMRSAQFLVLPSLWYEGFPMTIVEAFSCGCPVMASGIGSMTSVISDGESGLFFEAGNSVGLAQKIQWAFEHPEQMREMGGKARQVFEADYSAEANYQRLMEIYQHTF